MLHHLVLHRPCSSKTLAAAKRKLRCVLTETEFARVRLLVGDIQHLRRDHALLRDGFDLVVCCGVLHHLPDSSLGLQRLASLLRPDGVLQLATYSTISFKTWQPRVEAWLKTLPFASQMFQGAVSDPESREIRDLLVHFPEFFTYAGFLDLLFHPLERTGQCANALHSVVRSSIVMPMSLDYTTPGGKCFFEMPTHRRGKQQEPFFVHSCALPLAGTFTLNELLEGPIAASRLTPLGIFFLDVNAELVARRCFAKRFPEDPERKMVDLRLWHTLEEEEQDIFGRMHGVWLAKSGREETAAKRARSKGPRCQTSRTSGQTSNIPRVPRA
eukprot:s2048_g1.t2